MIVILPGAHQGGVEPAIDPDFDSIHVFTILAKLIIIIAGFFC